MIRRTTVALGAALLAGGCGAGAEPLSRPASSTSGRETRPLGVVVDPPTRLPEPRSSGRSERGLLTLEPPPDAHPAVDVVDRFFQAVVAEHEEVLAELFEPSGRMWAGRHRRQVSLMTAWSRRLDRLDYTVLAGTTMYRRRHREVYMESDAQLLARDRQLPMLPGPGEVLIRIRMSTAAAGGSRLFGDEVVFLLRRTTSGYKIAQMREDFRLP